VNRLLATTLAGVLLACAPAFTEAIPMSGAGFKSSVALLAPMLPLTVGQDQHSAFPGMTRESSGVIKLTWRQGSTHLSTDGKVMTAESYDNGLTWGNPQTIKVNLYRDPWIAHVGGINYTTWFGANATNPAMGAAVQRDGWEFSRRIDTLPQAAISGPIVRLPDGRLATAFYGKAAGESLWTAWMGWSSDNAWSWATNRIINEQAAGLSTAEPFLVVNGSTTHMLTRWGDTALGIRSSPDSGATWGPPRKILDNATGRPSVIATQSGTLVVVYRERPTKSAAMAYSIDNGTTWQPGGTVLPAPPGSPLGMTYAAMVETSPGVIRLVVGMEQAGGSSDLWGGSVTVP
jgi:hypothetical protein